MIIEKNSQDHWENRYTDDKDYSRWESPWRLGFYEWAVEHITDSKAKILDIGSGTGCGLRHVCKSHRDWQPSGADFAQTVVDCAVIPTITFDLRLDKVPSGYDYILCIQTLEHFRDPSLIVKRFLGAPAKQIIITVPYKEDISKHSEHEFSFDKRFFKKHGNCICDIRFNRIKAVYGMTFFQKINFIIRQMYMKKRRLIRRLFNR